MGDPGTTSSFVAARPIFRVGDTEMPALSDGLITMLVEETTEGLYRCEAAFGNWGTTGNNVGFLYFDRQVFDFGKNFTIDAGEGETAARVLAGASWDWKPSTLPVAHRNYWYWPRISSRICA